MRCDQTAAAAGGCLFKHPPSGRYNPGHFLQIQAVGNSCGYVGTKGKQVQQVLYLVWQGMWAGVDIITTHDSIKTWPLHIPESSYGYPSIHSCIYPRVASLLGTSALRNWWGRTAAYPIHINAH